MSALAALFVIGFFSGFHCAGMCGPIIYVATQPMQIELPMSGARRFGLHLVRQSWYHAGRIISYMMLGSLAGLLGASFFAIGGIQQGFSYVLGALIIGMGMSYLGLLPTKAQVKFARIAAVAKSWLERVAKENSGSGRLLLGLVTPLLPCGILYGIVIESASTASVAVGALHMAAFAIGTIPALLGFGVITASFQGLLRKRGPQIAGGMLIVMGLLTIGRGAGLIVTMPWQPKPVQCTTCQTH